MTPDDDPLASPPLSEVITGPPPPGESTATGEGMGAEPVEPVTRGWTARFTLLWFGFWMAWLVPIQLLLPNQLAALDRAHKVSDFGIINGLAGVVALIALPVCGTLCDRTRSRFGRRRVWMAAGLVVFAISVVCTGLQNSWQGVAVCWLIAAVGNSAASSGLTAAVADQVPDKQRGMVSGAIFGPQAIGILVGLVITTTVITSTSGGYLLLAIVLLVCAAPFVLRYRDSGAKAVGLPLTVRVMLRSMWVSPRRNPDFAWAFGGRLMVNVGNALGTTYLLYFLTDDLKMPDPDTSLLVVTAIYLIFTVTATYLGGIASDRSGRRRIFVAAASTLQAIAALLLTFAPSFTMTCIGGALLGAGYGAFLSVDQALITKVLPDAESRAKDLGIMNVGTNVPQSLAPLAAALIISSLGGYPVLFGTAGVATLIGAAMVYRVRSVR
ncbi:MAG TPA: MFS transporter [Pseudonocardiaceae bacterium]|nr:MFS transporter [Pseudonocardiaceae bacterium]